LNFFQNGFCFFMSESLEIVTSLVHENELSAEQIESVAKLINQVYLITEHDFWPHNGNYERTNVTEIARYIANRELIIAKIAHEIVGAVHVYPIKLAICGFGMLVAAPDKKGIGIGATLMEGIENWAKTNGYNSIQLELLKPVDYKHPDKEFLNSWYNRLGYRFISKSLYADLYPRQAHLLKIPCNFEIYQKNLKN